MWLSGDSIRGDRGFGRSNLENDGFDGFEETKSSMWPDVPDFSSFKDDDFFDPIETNHGGNSGSKINAIGAELKKNQNGNISPFQDSVSEDSDSNRWEPASLWRGKRIRIYYNTTLGSTYM